MAIKWEKMPPAEGMKILQNKWGMQFLLPDPEDTDEGIFQVNGEKLKTLTQAKVYPVAKFVYQNCTFYVSPPIEKDSKYNKEYMIVFFERAGNTHVVTTFRDEHQNTWVVPTYSDCSDESEPPTLGKGYETQETMTWPVPIQIFLMQVYGEFKSISVNRNPLVFETGVFVGDETPAIFWNEEAANEELVIGLGGFKSRDEEDSILYQFVAGMEPDYNKIEKVGTVDHPGLNRDVSLYYIPSVDGSVEYFVEYDSNLKQAAFGSIQPSIVAPRDYTPYGLNGKTFTRKSIFSYDATGTLIDKITLPLIQPGDKMPLGFATEDDKPTYTNEYLSKIKPLQTINKKIAEMKAKAQEAAHALEATAAAATTVAVAPPVVPPQNAAQPAQFAPQPTVPVPAPVVALSPIEAMVKRYQDTRLLKEDLIKSSPQPKGFAYNLFKNVETSTDKDDEILIDFMSKIFSLMDNKDNETKRKASFGLFVFVRLYFLSHAKETKLAKFASLTEQDSVFSGCEQNDCLNTLMTLTQTATQLHPALKVSIARIYQQELTKKKPG